MGSLDVSRQPGGTPARADLAAPSNGSPTDEQAAPAWPAVASEPRQWMTSAAYGRSAAVTYLAAVPSLIADLTPRLESGLAADAEEAGQALGRFDAELGARVAGFAPVLLRSEAASSSQIENLTATARDIFSAELGAKTGVNAELIAANTRSLQAAIDLANEISPEAISAMHRVLMDGQSRHTPGEYRGEQVWIGTQSSSPIGAEFVPPHHERVDELMGDLVGFASRFDVPALTSVAIAHAQFETIHPYTDGNGRTGRALAQSMLRFRGITRNVAVPVSAGLLADIRGYHQALTAYRAGDPNPIVRAFADASVRAVHNSRQLVAEIDAIRGSWGTRLRARRDSNAWRLLDEFAARPVLNAAAAAAALRVQQPNVYPPMKTLVEAGIVKSKAEHQLGPFWRSDEILEAVDAFAARAGRRGRA